MVLLVVLVCLFMGCVGHIYFLLLRNSTAFSIGKISGTDTNFLFRNNRAYISSNKVVEGLLPPRLDT